MPLKGVSKLVSFSDHEIRRIGNHDKRPMRGLNGDVTVEYRYHGNVVCCVNLNKKQFYLDACGWEGHPSTTITLHSYQHLYRNMGYIEVTHERAVKERWAWR